MPIIKVFETPAGASAPQSHTAAAVFARVLAMDPEPEQSANPFKKRSRGEKTRPRNPNRVTVDQHVFRPRASSALPEPMGALPSSS
jgi:hypothetical protein